MDENVLSSIRRSDESEAFGFIEPFDRTFDFCHPVTDYPRTPDQGQAPLQDIVTNRQSSLVNLKEERALGGGICALFVIN